jgi:hypothetical protein
MSALAASFPFVILLMAVTVAGLALRLDRRLSRGAHSAGPLEPERPKPAGLEQTPWELRGIDDQLTLAGRGSPAIPRYDLTATVNRLIVAAGMHDPGQQLPMSAGLGQLEQAVTNIVRMLGLPPLSAAGQPGPDHPARPVGPAAAHLDLSDGGEQANGSTVGHDRREGWR